MTLRPYQQEVVAKTLAAFRDFNRALVVLPTGGGKTICFSKLAAEFARTGKRTLILAHREELIEQAADKLAKATGIVAGIEKAERWAALDSPVVIGSVQTLIGDERRARWPAKHFSLVVCDEAHHAISASWQKVLGHFNAKILGVTATPDRGDKRNLGEYFETVSAEVALLDLIRDGYLSRIAIKAVPLAIDLNGVKSTAGDFNDAELGHAIEPLLGDIARAIAEHAAFRRTLVFLPLIQTSLKFVAECEKIGLRATHVDGTSPDRAERLNSFARGDSEVLSNAMLLTEGYDVDSAPTGVGIDCVVILRPTRSRPLYAQMVGRGTRPAPFKENLLLLDFLWNHERHSISRPAHLIAKDEAEADAMTALSHEAAKSGRAEEQAELELEALAESATHEREIALRKKLAEHSHRKAGFISAEEFALKHDQLAVAEFEPVMKWESQPISEAQSKYLQRAKIDPATVRGKGHASKLLSIFFAQQKLTLASDGQRQAMRRMGADNWQTATVRDAKSFFAGNARKAAA